MARGDEEFVEFAQASSPRLLHAAYLLTGDRHHAEDAAQTALVRTYAAWSRVRREDAFAYARRVLVNHVTDRWRRRLREYATGVLPDQPAKADIAEEVALRQWLIGALASLTARERAVIILRYFFDLPEANVADELRISVGTVKSTSSRGLAKLRISADPPDQIPADSLARIAGNLPAPSPEKRPAPSTGKRPAPSPGNLPAPSPGNLPTPSPGTRPSPVPVESRARIAGDSPDRWAAPPLGRMSQAPHPTGPRPQRSGWTSHD